MAPHSKKLQPPAEIQYGQFDYDYLWRLCNSLRLQNYVRIPERYTFTLLIVCFLVVMHRSGGTQNGLSTSQYNSHLQNAFSLNGIFAFLLRYRRNSGFQLNEVTDLQHSMIAAGDAQRCNEVAQSDTALVIRDLRTEVEGLQGTVQRLTSRNTVRI